MVWGEGREMAAEEPIRRLPEIRFLAYSLVYRCVVRNPHNGTYATFRNRTHTENRFNVQDGTELHRQTSRDGTGDQTEDYELKFM